MRTLLAVAVAFVSLSAHVGTIGSGPHGGMSERIPPHAATSR